MDAIMIAASKLNLIGRIIYEYLFGWVKSWNIQSSVIGAFAVTVIMFTLFLKLLTSPLDLWQKNLGRKNAKIMEAMKPELNAVTKQCGSNQQLLMQKQREIYKKYNYSMGKTCLPTVVTLAVFLIVFSGFNSAVRYHNEREYHKLRDAYNAAYEVARDEAYARIFAETGNDNTAKLAADREAIAPAEAAVLAAYEPERFMLTKNVFVADSWKSPAPSIGDFAGKSMGQMGITDVEDNEYNAVMTPIFREYNYNAAGKKVWNGYLILPVIAMLMNILSSRLIKPSEQPQMAGQTDEQRKMAEQQQKMMMFVMPLMFGVFTLFYSAAFTLYFLASNVITLAFNYTYNVVTKKKDAEEKDRILRSTIKR